MLKKAAGGGRIEEVELGRSWEVTEAVGPEK